MFVCIQIEEEVLRFDMTADQIVRYLGEEKEKARSDDIKQYIELRQQGLLQNYEVPIQKSTLGHTVTAEKIKKKFPQLQENLLVARDLLNEHEKEQLIRTGNLQVGSKPPNFKMSEGTPHYLEDTFANTKRYEATNERCSQTLGGLGKESTFHQGKSTLRNSKGDILRAEKKKDDMGLGNEDTGFDEELASDLGVPRMDVQEGEEKSEEKSSSKRKSRLGIDQDLKEKEVSKRMKHRLNYLKNPRFARAARQWRPRAHISDKADDDLLQMSQTLQKTRQQDSQLEGLNLDTTSGVQIEPNRIIRDVQPVERMSDEEGGAGSFVISPPDVRFGDYEVGGKYSVTITATNADHVSRSIRFLPPATKHFTMEIPRTQSMNKSSGTIAPGISISLIVYFTPESLTDYMDEVIILTEIGKFSLPLLGKRAQPEISLPLEIDCGSCMLNDRVDFTVGIKNVGRGPGTWVLVDGECDEEEIMNVQQILETGDYDNLENASFLDMDCFRVSPAKFHLNADCSLNLSISFQPSHSGHFFKTFLALCDNGHHSSHTLFSRCSPLEIGIVSANDCPLSSPSYDPYRLMEERETLQTLHAMAIHQSEPVKALLNKTKLPWRTNGIDSVEKFLRDISHIPSPYSIFRPASSSMRKETDEPLMLHFGFPTIGQRCERNIKVKNSCDVPVNYSLVLLPSLPAEPVLRILDDGNSNKEDRDNIQVIESESSVQFGSTLVSTMTGKTERLKGLITIGVFVPVPVEALHPKSNFEWKLLYKVSGKKFKDIAPSLTYTRIVEQLVEKEVSLQENINARSGTDLEEIQAYSLENPSCFSWKHDSLGIIQPHSTQSFSIDFDALFMGDQHAIAFLVARKIPAEGLEKASKRNVICQAIDLFSHVQPPEIQVYPSILPSEAPLLPSQRRQWSARFSNNGQADVSAVVASCRVYWREVGSGNVMSLSSFFSPSCNAVNSIFSDGNWICVSETMENSLVQLSRLELNVPAESSEDLTIHVSAPTNLGTYVAVIEYFFYLAADVQGERKERNANETDDLRRIINNESFEPFQKEKLLTGFTVAPPQIAIIQPEIDFGLLRTGNTTEKSVLLKNLSSVPAPFEWLVKGVTEVPCESAAEDVQGYKKAAEFEFDEATGTLEPNEQRSISVKCVAGPSVAQLRGYLCCQVLDNNGDGFNQIFIKIRGELQTPSVKLENNAISLGTTFVGQTVERSIQLINMSNLTTTFKMDGFVGLPSYLLDDVDHSTSEQEHLRSLLLRESSEPDLAYTQQEYESLRRKNEKRQNNSLLALLAQQLRGMVTTALQVRYEVQFLPDGDTLGELENRTIQFRITPLVTGRIHTAFACDVQGLHYPLPVQLKANVLALTVAYSYKDIDTGEFVDVDDMSKYDKHVDFKSALEEMDSANTEDPVVHQLTSITKEAEKVGAYVGKTPNLNFGQSVSLLRRKTLCLRIFNLSGIPTDFRAQVAKFPAWEGEMSKTVATNAEFARKRLKCSRKEIDPSLQSQVDNKKIQSRQTTATHFSADTPTKSHRTMTSTTKRSTAASKKQARQNLAAQLLSKDSYEYAMRLQSKCGQEELSHRDELKVMHEELSLHNGVAFRVSPAAAHLPPYGTADVYISCVADMPGLYDDELQVFMDGADDLSIPISVNISGEPLKFDTTMAGYLPPEDKTGTISPKEDPRALPALDFGTVTTNTEDELVKNMTLRNTSPMDAYIVWRKEHDRPQRLPLVDLRVVEDDSDSGQLIKTSITPLDPNRLEYEPPFDVKPKDCVIEAGSSATFVVSSVPSPATDAEAKVDHGHGWKQTNTRRCIFRADCLWTSAGQKPTEQAVKALTSMSTEQKIDETESDRDSADEGSFVQSRTLISRIERGATGLRLRITPKEPKLTVDKLPNVGGYPCIKIGGWATHSIRHESYTRQLTLTNNFPSPLTFSLDVVGPFMIRKVLTNSTGSSKTSKIKSRVMEKAGGTMLRSISAQQSRRAEGLQGNYRTIVNRELDSTSKTQSKEQSQQITLAPETTLIVTVAFLAHRCRETGTIYEDDHVTKAVKTFSSTLPGDSSLRMEEDADLSESQILKSESQSLKSAAFGALRIHFNNGTTQRILVRAELLHPLVAVQPAYHDFGTLHTDTYGQQTLHVLNPTVVPAHWKVQHIPWPKPRTRVDVDMSSLGGADENVRELLKEQQWQESTEHFEDCPDVFRFDKMEGVVEGPTPPPQNASLSELRKAKHLPENVKVTFNPAANKSYRCRFRFVVDKGEGFEVVLVGRGSYDEQFDKI